MSDLNMDQIKDVYLKNAKEHGVDFDLIYEDGSNFKSTFQNEKLDEFGFSKSMAFGLRVIKDGNEGYASTENFSKASVERTFSEALANSKVVKGKYNAFLPENTKAEELKGLFSPELSQIDVERKLKNASYLESEAKKFDSKIKNVPNNRYSDFSSTTRIVNSKGFDQSYQSSGCFAYSACLANEGDKNVVGFYLQITRDYNELDTKNIGQTAAKRALKRLSSQDVKTGKYPIVLCNEIVNDLMGQITDFFSAKSIDEKTSPLTGKLDKKIFSEKLTITDDPLWTKGFAARPFDSEGVPSQKTQLVESGVLKTYLTNSVYAKQLGIKNTGHGSRGAQGTLEIEPTNLIIQSGNKSFAELVKTYPEVIAITAIKGLAGFNNNNGDFSIQVEGDLYKNGEFQYSLNAFVLAGNILQAFSDVDEVGNDNALGFPGFSSPSLLIRELSVAGQN